MPPPSDQVDRLKARRRPGPVANALVVLFVGVPSAVAAGTGIVGFLLGPLIGAELGDYLRVGVLLLGGLAGAWGAETLRGRPSGLAVAAPGAAVCGMAAGAWVLYGVFG